MVLHGWTRLQPASRSAHATSSDTPGGVVRDEHVLSSARRTSASDRESSPRTTRRVRVSSRSPMCWLTNAWPSTTSVTLFFRSAPSASIGRSTGKRRDGARRVAARAAQDRRAERADRGRPSRRRGARSAARRRETRRRCPPGARTHRRPGTRSARSSGWRWSSPAASGAPAREQQMMQRRVRQHHAELAIVRRHSGQLPHAPAQARSAAPRDVSSALAASARARTSPRADVEIARPSARTAVSLRNLRSRSDRDRGGVRARRTPGDSRRGP